MVLLHRVARRDPPPPRHERLGRRHAKHHGAYHSAPRPPLRDAALRARVRLHAHVAQRRHALCAHPDVQLQPHQRRGRAGGEGTEDLHRRHARRRPGRRRIRHGQLRRRPPPEHDRLRADGRGLAQRGRGALPRPRELHDHERPRRRHGHRRRSHARHDHPAPEHGRHAGVRRQPRELRALRRHVRLRRAEHLRRQPHDHAHAVHPGRLRRTDAHRLRTRQRRRQRHVVRADVQPHVPAPAGRRELRPRLGARTVQARLQHRPERRRRQLHRREHLRRGQPHEVRQRRARRVLRGAAQERRRPAVRVGFDGRLHQQRRVHRHTGPRTRQDLPAVRAEPEGVEQRRRRPDGRPRTGLHRVLAEHLRPQQQQGRHRGQQLQLRLRRPDDERKLRLHAGARRGGEADGFRLQPLGRARLRRHPLAESRNRHRQQQPPRRLHRLDVRQQRRHLRHPPHPGVRTARYGRPHAADGRLRRIRLLPPEDHGHLLRAGRGRQPDLLLHRQRRRRRRPLGKPLHRRRVRGVRHHGRAAGRPRHPLRRGRARPVAARQRDDAERDRRGRPRPAGGHHKQGELQPHGGLPGGLRV